jgi:hypothetical protein
LRAKGAEEVEVLRKSTKSAPGQARVSQCVPATPDGTIAMRNGQADAVSADTD